MFGKIVLLIFAILATCYSQEIHPGQCPQVDAVGNFNIDFMGGTWYEIKRYQIESIPGIECVKAIYSQWNETFLAVDVTGKNPSTNEVQAYHGSMTEMNPGENIGIVKVNIDGVPIEEIVHLLVFDHARYSLSWACFYIEETDMNYQFMWVHARTTEMTPADETVIEEAINNYGLNSTLLYDTIQDQEYCATGLN